MSLFKQVKQLFLKDLLIELRNKYVLGGLFLYVLSSILVIYFSLQYNNNLRHLSPVLWSILFWQIVLFSSINAIANSFFREPEGRTYYSYWMSSPQAILLSKLLYNFVFTLLLSLVSFVVFAVLIANPVQQYSLFFLTVLLGGTSYSFLFTTMSAIAARAGNNTTLVAVLGFPLVIPLLIFITKLTAASLNSSEIGEGQWRTVGLLLAFNALLLGMGYILFPYIWRD